MKNSGCRQRAETGYTRPRPPDPARTNAIFSSFPKTPIAHHHTARKSRRSHSRSLRPAVPAIAKPVKSKTIQGDRRSAVDPTKNQYSNLDKVMACASPAWARLALRRSVARRQPVAQQFTGRRRWAPGECTNMKGTVALCFGNMRGWMGTFRIFILWFLCFFLGGSV